VILLLPRLVCYMQNMTMHLLEHLPKALILAAYAKAAGNELERKAESPESSSALVANAFGWFLDRPHSLPPLPGLEGATWPATRVCLEANLRFPWSGGRHPWLDVLVETPTHLVGIESKRFEPFRGRHSPKFSPAFDRDVWLPGAQPYIAALAALKSGSLDLWALDAAQLVKHALALSTQAEKLGKKPALVYLHANPIAWPDGRLISDRARAQHAEHLAVFAKAIAGADVQFSARTYANVCQSWLQGPADLQHHARAVMAHFHIV
jgi:hypothetical protein